MNYLIVFLGAGLGGALTHGVNVLSLRFFASDFPYGTLAINVLGSFVMGALAAWFAFRGDVSQSWRLFLTTGVLGGFTTFSAFSLEVALLWERGEALAAVTYVLASTGLSIGGLVLGLWLLRSSG